MNLAERMVHKREFVYERIEGADHGLKIKTKDGLASDMQNVITKIVDWCFGSVPKKN